MDADFFPEVGATRERYVCRRVTVGHTYYPGIAASSTGALFKGRAPPNHLAFFFFLERGTIALANERSNVDPMFIRSACKKIERHEEESNVGSLLDALLLSFTRYYTILVALLQHGKSVPTK